MTEKIASSAPCPLTDKPCMSPNGHPYYYPADCADWHICMKGAIESDPCPCEQNPSNWCDGDCDYIRGNDYH